MIVAAGAGISADILTSGGAAASHSSHGSQPDVFTVDDRNQPLNAGTLKVENEVLADARHHDRAALGRLIDATNPNDPKVIAQNQVLDQPGAYAQIVTLLTKTHGAAQDAQIMWPGFLLAGTGSPLDAADARSLGVTSTPNGDANYKGISVNIQVEAYSQSGYQLSPKLDGIFQTNP